MKDFRYIVTIHAKDRETADAIMCNRLDCDEELADDGVLYAIDWDFDHVDNGEDWKKLRRLMAKVYVMLLEIHHSCSVELPFFDLKKDHESLKRRMEKLERRGRKIRRRPVGGSHRKP